MGSYLSEPVCEKVSTDEVNDKLKYGASSMQGWRVSQEDAHNCILDYDTNTAFFAVYDGHGGHEVAHYCSLKLPDFIKNHEAYKNGKFEQALTEGFLGFDGTITSREVVAVLKEIAGDKEAEDEDDEENVDNLYEEATMPIEKVIEKYTNLVNPAVRNLKKGEGDKFPKSPCLKSKKDSDAVGSSSAPASSSSDASAGSSSSSGSSDVPCNDGVSSSDSSEAKTSSEVKEEAKSKVEANGSAVPIPEIKVSSADSSEEKEAECKEEKQNGEASPAVVQQLKNDVTSSSTTDTPPENGNGDIKGKGKAIPKTPKTPVKSPINRSTRNQLYKTLLTFNDQEDSDDDTEDEDDKTFEGPNEDSSDDDNDDSVNVAIENEDSEEESSDGEEEEGEEEEEEDEDEEDLEFARNMKEEPGSDSGCTAVVALLKGNDLYVANAGDSRCIVCRNGKAVEMSFDHKPEDEPERERVVKAGGKVTLDGRVNGGLNLSRAIGDHAYKQNKELSDREQMITALPDIKTLTINPADDEFMVLACDGIWNFMSSQEVVDFVRPRLQTCEKLSTICEEMFDHCLAPNTMGDGTGCDNMTAIIVKFKTNILKRSASEVEKAAAACNDEAEAEPTTESSNKRPKTESTTESAVATPPEVDTTAT